MIWLRRVGSGLLIGLISLLLLEAVLQLAAVAVRISGRDVSVDAASGSIKVLAVGDSNTYGLYYPEDKAWPAQFESSWNEQRPDTAVSVINLGYPGTNSYRVKANIEGFLKKTSSDWVFLMIGFNDFWTPAESPDNSLVIMSETGWLDAVRKYSRVYKLVYMLQQNYRGHIVNSKFRLSLPESVLNNPEKHQAFLQELFSKVAEQRAKDEASGNTLEKKQDQGVTSEDLIIDGERFPMLLQTSGQGSGLQQFQPNLESIAAQVDAYGARLLLLTYPASRNLYPQYSEAIRSFAHANNLPLIDLQEYFKQVCDGDVDCFEYFLFDGHLNDKGYELAGQFIAERFADIAIGDDQRAMH